MNPNDPCIPHLIAQGGEADVHAIDEHTVLRVARIANGKTSSTERIIEPVLESHGIPAPRIREFLTIDGKLAEVMDRIHGTSMLEDMLTDPATAMTDLHTFIHLFSQVLSIHEDDIPDGSKLSNITDTMHALASSDNELPANIKEFATHTLNELPRGDALCHGDFHPGNILMQDGQPYIIDWSSAHLGNPVSDIAHTYLLLTYAPKIPGQGEEERAQITEAGRQMADLYLKLMHEVIEFSDEEFRGWLIIMSWYRFAYGLSTEHEERLQFLSDAHANSLAS